MSSRPGGLGRFGGNVVAMVPAAVLAYVEHKQYRTGAALIGLCIAYGGCFVTLFEAADRLAARLPSVSRSSMGLALLVFFLGHEGMMQGLYGAGDFSTAWLSGIALVILGCVADFRAKFCGSTSHPGGLPR